MPQIMPDSAAENVIFAAKNRGRTHLCQWFYAVVSVVFRRTLLRYAQLMAWAVRLFSVCCLSVVCDVRALCAEGWAFRQFFAHHTVYCRDVWYGITRVVWLPTDEKNLKICLFILTEFTNVTDRRTDRQTGTAWRHRPVALAQHRAAEIAIHVAPTLQCVARANDTVLPAPCFPFRSYCWNLRVPTKRCRLIKLWQSGTNVCRNGSSSGVGG